MPFGGIFSIRTHPAAYAIHDAKDRNHGCYMCTRAVDSEYDLWVDEDGVMSYLHRLCLPAFLESEIGRAMLAAGRSIILPPFLHRSQDVQQSASSRE